MLTIVDNFSKATWTFLMHHKTRTLNHLCILIQNQLDTMIKTIKTDNGTKFTSHEFSIYLSKKGILHQKTCPYTPKKNGKVERKHRHLLEVAQALMFESALPKKKIGLIQY